MHREPQKGRSAQPVAGALLVLALTAIVAVAAQANRGSTAAPLLPDLDQEAPSELELTTSGPARAAELPARLSVGGAERRRRPARDSRTALGGGDGRRSGDPAGRRLARRPCPRWARSSTSARPTTGTGTTSGSTATSCGAPDRPHAVVRDRKSGFCLGDRYRATDVRLANAAPTKVYRGRCGLDEPGRAEIEEGISVGYGDAYSAFLEYQDLPLDGLPAGRYVLVHQVNADRRLRELSYANNAASVLLELRWRRGVPYLRALAYCEDSASCSRSSPARS